MRAPSVAQGALLLLFVPGCSGSVTYAFTCPPAICNVPSPPPAPPPRCDLGTPDPTAVNTTLAEIVRNPRPWIGRHVRVRGVLDATFEMETLYDPKTRAWTRYHFGPDLRREKNLYDCVQRLVIVEGIVGPSAMRRSNWIGIHDIQRIRATR